MPDGATFSRACADHSAPDPRCVTVIATDDPVRKTFAVDPATGDLTKSALAKGMKGVATTCRIESLADMRDLIRETSEMHDRVLVLGVWRDAPPFGAPFGVASGFQCRMQPWRYRPRNKEAIEQSVFLLLDFDNWPGMPTAWAAMDAAARLAFLEAVLPGISRCARLEWCSSSARVVPLNHEGPGRVSHAIIEVSDATLVPALVAYVKRAIKRGLCGAPFIKSNGHVERRTVIDLMVWSPERLVFVAPPCTKNAPGLKVLAADPRIVNPEGGALDISWLQPAPIVIDAWAAEPAPETWADEVPPHESAERVLEERRARGLPVTLPDPARAVEGNRDDTAFWFVFLSLVHWCDVRDSNIVPVEIARRFYMEAVERMRCDTTELRGLLDYKARHIASWFAQTYVPNQRQRSAPKTEAERRANRRAGQRKSCATKEAGSIARIRAEIASIQGEGGRLSKAAVARRTGIDKDTVAKHWKAATGTPARTSDLGRATSNRDCALAAAAPPCRAPALPPVLPPAADAPAADRRRAAASATISARARRAAAIAPLRLDVLRRIGSPALAAIAVAVERPGRGPPPW